LFQPFNNIFSSWKKQLGLTCGPTYISFTSKNGKKSRKYLILVPQIYYSSLTSLYIAYFFRQSCGIGCLQVLMELKCLQLDPDFVADFAQGELRADMTHDRAVGKPNSDPDSRDTSTAHSANYAVSPRELSLRLHEVIRSRLEERVQDLETALQNSQRKLNHMESGHKNSWKEFSSSERAYSCTPESSTAKECNPTAQFPVNLSGETLDADKELTKIDDSEEQDLASRVHESKHQEGFNLSDGPVFMGENGGSMPNLTMDMELFSSKTRTRRCGGYTSEFQGLNDGVSEDESSDWDDEIENQLIKQIVEKTKKGSHVVLNAQRMFLSMDEK